MNELVKKTLKISGILGAISAGAALLIGLTNLVTAPVISENARLATQKALTEVVGEGYTFSEATEIDDADYLSKYWTAEKTDETATIFYGEGSNTYGSVGLVVALSGDKNNPTYGAMSIITDTETFKEKLEGVYVANYNANPSTTTLNDVKCGATYGAKLIRSIILEAVSYYGAM